MNSCRTFAISSALVLLAQPAVAQDAAREADTPRRPLTQEMIPGLPDAGAGTIEFGLFLQPSYLGSGGRFEFDGQTVGLDSRTVMAFGARLGVFLTPAWSLELDAVSADPKAETGQSVDFRALSARANYNFTITEFGERTSFLVGAGVTRVESRGGEPRRTEDKWGASALAGARFNVGGPINLRGDIVADFVPSALNLGLRLGVGVLFGSEGLGGRGRTAEPTPPPADPGPSLPPPQPEPEPDPGFEEDRAAALAGVDTIPLSRSIYFDYDQVNIRADAIPVLEEKVRWLLANPRLQLRIEGHADDRGQDEYNLSLSQRRAAETHAWFVSRGIAAERLPIVGYGEEFRLCIQDPMTEACHQLNRRADFRIMRVGSPRLVPPR